MRGNVVLKHAPTWMNLKYILISDGTRKKMKTVRFCLHNILEKTRETAHGWVVSKAGSKEERHLKQSPGAYFRIMEQFHVLIVLVYICQNVCLTDCARLSKLSEWPAGRGTMSRTEMGQTGWGVASFRGVALRVLSPMLCLRQSGTQVEMIGMTLEFRREVRNASLLWTPGAFSRWLYTSSTPPAMTRSVSPLLLLHRVYSLP